MRSAPLARGDRTRRGAAGRRARVAVLAAALPLVVALGVPACASAQGRKPPRPPASPTTPPKEPCDEPSFTFSTGGAKQGYLGVQVLRLTDELRAHFRAPKDAGLLVSKIEKDSPAQAAGIRVGDILVEVDGVRVGSVFAVARLVQKKKEGERAAVKVLRGGKELVLQAAIKLRDRPRIEIGAFFRSGPFDEEFEVDWGERNEAFEKAMEQARKRIETLGGKKGLFRFFERESDLEKQLREMQERLRQLEHKLQGSEPRGTGRRTAM
jgi:hypothetical protein